jgi:phosphoglycolate phosphatase-like HAD superfamily hydrolase
VTRRPIAVLDIDGVLADVGHRLHHLSVRPKNWEAFFAAAADDPPLAPGVALARELADTCDVAYLTGRPAALRATTVRWLERHDLPEGRLLMRRQRDFRPARVTKLEALRALAREGPVQLVVDDDTEVVAALAAAGFPVRHATWAPRSRELRRAQERDGRT